MNNRTKSLLFTALLVITSCFLQTNTASAYKYHSNIPAELPESVKEAQKVENNRKYYNYNSRRNLINNIYSPRSHIITVPPQEPSSGNPYFNRNRANPYFNR